MKFDFKSVPFPKAAKKSMPKGATNTAFKVRQDGEVKGTVLHSEIDNGELWGYFREGKVYGGFNTKEAAAEGLVSS